MVKRSLVRSKKTSESCTRFLIEQLSTKCSSTNKNILGVSAMIDRKRTLPAALRCLHKPKYAEKSIWASRFCQGEARTTAAAHCEAAFDQVIYTTSVLFSSCLWRSFPTSSTCSVISDVRRRQTYWHMSLRRMWPGHASRPFWGCV